MEDDLCFMQAVVGYLDISFLFRRAVVGYPEIYTPWVLIQDFVGYVEKDDPCFDTGSRGFVICFYVDKDYYVCVYDISSKIITFLNFYVMLVCSS